MRHLLITTLALFAVACAAAETGDAGDDEDLKLTTSNISASCNDSRADILASVTGARRTAIQRGFGWLDAHVPYSQGASHGGYRTDCSGFVSMCWGLGTSLTTGDFAAGTSSQKLGSYEDLVPGDALVRRVGTEGHIMLFLGWNDAAHSGACVLEEASTASDMQFRVHATSSLKSQSFKAIEATKLAGSAPVDPVAKKDAPVES